jgi:hypothetical protein
MLPVSSKDDCSAQKRPRELKLVSLELSENEDSEYVCKIFLARLYMKIVMQNVQQHLFSKAAGERRSETHWPTEVEVLETATLNGFDENDRFFTISCDPYMDQTLRLFFYTFHHKKDKMDGF